MIKFLRAAFLAAGLSAGAAQAVAIPKGRVDPAGMPLLSVSRQDDRRAERHARDAHAEQLHRELLNRQDINRQNRQATTRSEEIRRQDMVR